MIINLVDSMRTCAAYIMSRPNDAPMPSEHLLDDAADLLIEASNVLSALPMAIIPPQPQAQPQAQPTKPLLAQWTGGDLTAGDLPSVERTSQQPRSPRSCPQCGSFTAKKVTRDGTQLMLGCPVCGHSWPYSVGAVA